MLSALIEAGDEDAERLAHTLAALVPALVEGLLLDAVVMAREGGPAARVADAAGARVVASGSPARAVAAARGAWLLLLEPGARPLEGWTEPVRLWLEVSKGPARFTLEGEGWGGVARLFRRPRALRSGLILARGQAEVAARNAASLEALARGRSARRLPARLLPARP